MAAKIQKSKSESVAVFRSLVKKQETLLGFLLLQGKAFPIESEWIHPEQKDTEPFAKW